MINVGLLFFGIVVAGQTISICRPLKENEFYTLKTMSSTKIGKVRRLEDGLVEHRCTEIDSHDVEHIEAKCVEGTVKIDDGEADSMKGETYNYFQNSHGQRFEYEEIRLTLKDDPDIFFAAEIHSKLRDGSVVPEETWKGKSSHTEYSVVVGIRKQFMKTECIEVLREGKFMNGISGEFKEGSWYRTSDGQLMYQQTTADNVVTAGLDEISFLERLELVPNKA